MLYLYLDESGDLGFDFVNKKPSKFFTITILVISGSDQNKKLLNAVDKTLKRKLNSKNREYFELKGATTTFEIKKYFYAQVKDIKFDLYSVTIDKKRSLWKLVENKARIYNFIARTVIDQIAFNKFTRIELIVDKSKGKLEILEFNNYIKQHLGAKIAPATIIDIYHWDSRQNYGLQACDLFCSGIFQEYERKDSSWIEVFREERMKYNKILEI